MRGAELLERRAHLLRAFGQEVLHQAFEITGALPQGRQLHGQDVETVVEIFAEVPGLDLFGQIAVGRGDHAHVDLAHQILTEALDFTLLERAKQLRLRAKCASSPTSSRNRVALIGEFEEDRDDSHRRR